MTPVEKLARRICWLEFGGRKPSPDMTEARYWKQVHPTPKANYLEEARRLKWLLRELDRSKDGWNLLEGQ